MKNSTSDNCRQNADNTDTTTIEYDNDIDTASYKSFKYFEKWCQQIQKNVHSMQLDLLHFRSRSLNYHCNDNNDEDTSNMMDVVVPKYTRGSNNDTRAKSRNLRQ